MRRIDMDRLQELVRLHRMGTGCREIARLLAMSPNTERQYRTAIAAAGLLKGPVEDLPAMDVLRAAVGQKLGSEPPPQQSTSLQRWRAALQELFDKGLGPRASYDRLRLDHADFGGSYWSVKRLWRRYKKQRGVRAEDVAIPVETGPGEVAQVDFGYVGRLYDPQSGSLRKTWAFVMVACLPKPGQRIPRS
jgi:hypothetical protein